ncbi:MAG: lamin tail domain-containing protein, partial [bacterium]
MINKCVHSLILTLLILCTFSNVTAGPSLLISEVFYDTPGTDSKEEWIEVFNSTSNQLDIGNYKLKDSPSGTYTIPVGTVIESGQTMIFAKNTAGFAALYGFNPDFGNLSLSLSNSGDFVKLFDATDNLLDIVAWEGKLPGWAGLAANTGESLVRISFEQGPSAWLGNQTPTPGSVVPEP